MGLVLDTSALVDLERKGEALLSSLPEEATEIFIPSLVLAELWVGVEMSETEEQRIARLGKINSMLENATVIPFGEELAPTYARLHVELRRQGTPIPSNDLAVAATAIYFGHKLVVGTHDEAHFRKVPGLSVAVLGGH